VVMGPPGCLLGRGKKPGFVDNLISRHLHERRR
jgi:hypothetical protein